MNFKDRLKHLRRNYYIDGKRLTQEKLGEVLGYKYTSVSNYESGRNEPCIRDLIKLSKFFNVSLDYLVCASEEENNIDKADELYKLCSSFSNDEQDMILSILKEIKNIKDANSKQKI